MAKESKSESTLSNGAHWNVEDVEFWNGTGARIARRNLLISIPCLLASFAVWMSWSVITVRMKDAGFPFSDAQIFTLAGIAGLSGATLRIPNSFLVAISGGRNVIFISTVLLLAAPLGLTWALQDKSVGYEAFVVLAALSGVGGGNFASSMSNISFFFPKRMQGTALGLNAGIGNLGVSVTQLIPPLVAAVPLFGAISGGGFALGAKAGGHIWIANMAFMWVPILIALAAAAWFGMTNLPSFRIERNAPAILKALGLELIGFAAVAIGVLLLLAMKPGLGALILVLCVTICAALLLMRLVPGQVAVGLKRQFGIFRSKHTWIMTWLYVMTFGSFIGFSNALPLLIKVVFGRLPGGAPNPNAPNPVNYAWLGPLVGSLIRPVGGWLSDKFGGARVTQWTTAIMICAALGVAHFVEAASASASPETQFAPFLLLFLLLFITTGIGNGSTFRMIPIIFESSMAGPVLGWSSAVAAYGSFIIPKVFSAEVDRGTPQRALFGFAAYYATCLVVNWWFYCRRNAEIRC